MDKVTVYTTQWCGWCRRLKSQLDVNDVNYYVEIDIEQDRRAAEIVKWFNGGNQTVPTVLLPNGTHLTTPTWSTCSTV